MTKAYRFLLPLAILWLIAWIVLSWAAIQDDALIHLRYANNLFLTHHISYDGVHPDYGASSILYITLLAYLRSFFISPDLPRAVSSAAHLVLFCGVAWLLLRRTSNQSKLARALSGAFLLLLITPSAVRWLDDGMETGLALCCVGLLCWLTFNGAKQVRGTLVWYLVCVCIAFVTVMLRTELILPCGLSWALLLARRLEISGGSDIRSSKSWLSRALSASPMLLGGVLALVSIRLRMHVLLPDTALAKSHGIGEWHGVMTSTPKVLLGAMSFGTGFLILWLVTVAVVLLIERMSLSTLLANTVFPITFALAVVRGQEIQGARYLVWTFFFSTLWNILEVIYEASSRADRRTEPSATGSNSATRTLYATRVVWIFLVVLLVFQPVEGWLMYHVLKLRAETMSLFRSQHLEQLEGKHGVAFDVGYIGYFSKARICDLAGLVNGREAARMTSESRAAACAASQPDFIFGNLAQVKSLQDYMSLDDWQLCGRYDFINLRSSDSHYLILPPTTYRSLCHAITGEASTPIAGLLRTHTHP